MVSTIKFSEFAASDLNSSTNKSAGLSGGDNATTEIVVRWTTAGRPSAPFNGLLGYNTDMSQYEYYDTVSATWIQLDTGDSGTVTLIDTGTGLTGGPITETGTISFAAIAGNSFWANTTGGVAVPTVTALAGIGSPLTTKGDLYTFTTVNARLGVGASDGQILQVNSIAATGLVWSTATYPSVATSIGSFIYADGTNFVASTSLWPNTVGTALHLVLSDGTSNVYSTPAYPNASVTSGKIIISDGTNYIASTSIWPNTVGTSGKIVISDGTSNVYSTPTYPNAATSTGSFLYADGTNWVASTSLWPNTVGAVGKIIRSDGTVNAYTTATYPDTSGASSNVLTSDGTNWISSAPAASATSVIVDDTTTNATMYPVWVTAATGSLPLKVSSTKLSFNPSTGTMTLTGSLLAVQFISSAAGLGILAFGSTPSAVNYMTVINNTTGNPPVFNSNGTDTNIGVGFQMKGTGAYQFFGSADASAEIRLYEDTDDGANYIGLKAPAIPSSLTFTLPSIDGNLNYPLRTNGSGVLAFGQTPAFSAYASGATTLTASAVTKVLFATENFDIGGYFASSTYTPLKAGIYQVNWLVSLTGTNVVTTSRYVAILFKNGTGIKNGTEAQAIAAGPYASGSSHLVSMNGSTDTLEVHFFNANAATSVTSESGNEAATYFSAVWVGPLT